MGGLANEGGRAGLRWVVEVLCTPRLCHMDVDASTIASAALAFATLALANGITADGAAQKPQEREGQWTRSCGAMSHCTTRVAAARAHVT